LAKRWIASNVISSRPLVTTRPRQPSTGSRSESARWWPAIRHRRVQTFTLDQALPLVPEEARAPGFRFLRAASTNSSPVGAADTGEGCCGFVNAGLLKLGGGPVRLPLLICPGGTAISRLALVNQHKSLIGVASVRPRLRRRRPSGVRFSGFGGVLRVRPVQPPSAAPLTVAEPVVALSKPVLVSTNCNVSVCSPAATPVTSPWTGS
jgi:hypothetical protein